MDVKHFEYVLEIAECGSINKATGKLHISQPNLSVCIKNLEEELGFKIFERGNRGVVPTPEGELFLRSARRIKDELDAIANIPRCFATTDNLSISCTNSFDFMNSFMKFKKMNPPRSSEDSIKETGLIQTVRDVVEMRYRLSFFYCFDCMEARYRDFALKHQLKMETVADKKRLVLFVSKAHPLARKKAVNFDDIKKYKFVMYENYQFDEWLQLLGFESSDKVLMVFDRGGLIDAVKQNLYVTVMMERFTDVYSEGCVEVPIENTDRTISAFLFYHDGYKLNQREQLFVRTLKKLFSDKPRTAV